MGNSFVLFYVSIAISHGQFHCGNRGHTQNTDFPWVRSHFPVGKRSSVTASFTFLCQTNVSACSELLSASPLHRLRLRSEKKNMIFLKIVTS